MQASVRSVATTGNGVSGSTATSTSSQIVTLFLIFNAISLSSTLPLDGSGNSGSSSRSSGAAEKRSPAQISTSEQRILLSNLLGSANRVPGSSGNQQPIGGFGLPWQRRQALPPVNQTTVLDVPLLFS